MEEHRTKKSTRIIMWVIAIVMAGGFIGSYFLIIIQNNQNTPQAQAQQQQSQAQSQQKVDPSAYIVKGKVDQLQVIDEKTGSGAEAKAGDSVTVQYKGTIAQTGVKFDSSWDRGEPATISLNQVIAGWQQGIPGMKVGGQRRLIIPSALGYGPSGTSGIPPNSDLVFEVELLAVNPKQ